MPTFTRPACNMPNALVIGFEQENDCEAPSDNYSHFNTKGG